MENIEELRQPLLSQDVEPQGIPIIFNTGMQHAGTVPFSTSPIFGTSEDSLCDHPGGTEVIFLNLTENIIFDKFQSRRGGEARMRVLNGNVQMVCKSPVQIMCIKVFVFREPDAAKLCGDDNGRMELPVKMGNMEVPDCSGIYQQFFSVDLDSIYDGPKKPAYELAKVETEIRNQFQLAVEVQYIGGAGFQEFISIPFLLRTRPKKPKNGPNGKASKRVRLPDSTDGMEVYSPDTSRPRLENGVMAEGIQFSPSSISNSSEYRIFDCDDMNVRNHLRANQASIDHLTFKNLETTDTADIGYRFALKTPHLEAYDEGDVVGFFKDEKGGTYIDLLDSINAQDTFMAGVISRSAYLEAKQSLEKDVSDVVCVIGVVQVKCAGSVRAGERIYSALIKDRAGTAIAESHLSPGAILSNRGTLLGMALEEKKTKKPGDETLVKCFVCIVMGITDKQVTMEIETMYDNVEMTLTDKLKEERKRARRVLCLSMGTLVFLLFGLSVLAFELFYPGSALREAICKAGSMDGHWATYKFIGLSKDQSYFVKGVEFASFDKLKEKVKPALDDVSPLSTTVFNITRVHYYLNLYRCSYGTVKLRNTLGIDPRKQVGGPQVFAIDGKCSTVYYQSFVNVTKFCRGGWCPYQSVKTFKNKFHCFPTKDFTAK
ncbi:uncharacterized protein LOC110231434 [Exaiptasia diaphana]|uniref:Uncharacterized protein n=1 Tax=Exaiptasia diaphana TaxID=2652724 RepID=A0A913YC63_EXADI|nr:uncharacterized protein LOC110231434 [Exaiptasia diaphana]